jgi:hypothetical protein
MQVRADAGQTQHTRRLEAAMPEQCPVDELRKALDFYGFLCEQIENIT